MAHSLIDIANRGLAERIKRESNLAAEDIGSAQCTTSPLNTAEFDVSESLILDRELTKRGRKKANTNRPKTLSTDQNIDPILVEESTTSAESSLLDIVPFKQETWRAVLALNIFRFITSMMLLGWATLSEIQVLNLSFSGNYALFAICLIALILSSVIGTVVSIKQRNDFNQYFSIQLASDLVLVSTASLALGQILQNNYYILALFLIVMSGSVVLNRIQAMGLAAASVLALGVFVIVGALWQHSSVSDWHSFSLISCGLFIAAATVSYLAVRIRQIESQTFIPGEEPIGDYLERMEKHALLTALETSQGNKTEAAKLLGMTFRSFRYKLKKFEIV